MRAVIFVRVRRLDVETTDGDDGGGRPVFLHFAGGPEKLEEPLWVIAVSRVNANGSQDQRGLLQDRHGSAVRQADQQGR